MSAALRSRCTIDLGFPFHRAETPAERLRALADWMEERGAGWDLYCAGSTAEALEARIAELTGKDAAVWMPSGTMGQGIAARLHCARTGTNRLGLHPSSHLLLHEQDGVRHVHGLEPVEIGAWRREVRASDLTDDLGCAIIELGQRQTGGLLPDWETLEALKAEARARGIPLQMDGARLWSVRPHFDNRSYAEVCEGFSSVYVSFYKDIGAIGGAALAGDKDFVAEMRAWRARMGGMLPMAWPNIADALRRLDREIAAMPDRVARARLLGDAIARIDGLDVLPVQTNLFHVLADAPVDAIEAARNAVAEEDGIWLFGRCWDYPDQAAPAIEMSVGETLLALEPQIVIDAFTRFAQRLPGKS